MPYKRHGSPFYQIRLRLIGFGRTPVLTTGVTSKAVARQMERAVMDLAERALIDPTYEEVLRGVLSREIDLPTYMRYKYRAYAGITELRRLINDPPLAPIIETMMARNPDHGTGVGLRHLANYGVGIRLSKLRDPRAVREMCYAMETTGVKRNSVRRTLLRVISKILRQEFGPDERDRVIRAVNFPATDDSRKVNLTKEEIGRLIDSASGEFRVMVLMAVLTGADRGVLTKLRVRDLSIFVSTDGEYSGSVYLGSDRKTKARARSVGFDHMLGQALYRLCRLKTPEALVFSVKYSQVDYLWHTTREKAGLPDVRFKDLRHMFASLAHEAGIPLNIVKAGLGHDKLSTTTRYTDQDQTFDTSHARAIEGLLGRVG